MCNNPIPQMLGIRAIAEMYCLPVHFVRALVNRGEVVAVRVGKKILVNTIMFGEFLNSNKLHPINEITKDETDTSSNIGGTNPRIAPIPADRGR